MASSVPMRNDCVNHSWEESTSSLQGSRRFKFFGCLIGDVPENWGGKAVLRSLTEASRFNCAVSPCSGRKVRERRDIREGPFVTIVLMPA